MVRASLVKDGVELRAEPAVISPTSVDYVNTNAEFNNDGSGDYSILNKDNDDEDIQSPTEDSEVPSEDLFKDKTIEEPIRKEFIVPVVTFLEDNNTSTQSDMKSTSSQASTSSTPSTSTVVSMISIKKPEPPASLPTATITTSPATSKSSTTSTTTTSTKSTSTISTSTTSAAATTSTSASTSTSSTVISFETLPNSYSDDDESEFDWSSSDYDEIEKFSKILKVHKKPMATVTDSPKTVFAITHVPMLKQTDLNMYQELIAAREKRQLFVYNHDQCISYKDGSKSSSFLKTLIYM